MPVHPAGTVDSVSSGESAPRPALKRSVATVEASSLATNTSGSAGWKAMWRGPAPGRMNRVAPLDVAQRFSVEVELADEYAVGAEVCGKREAVGGIGKDAVGVRRFLTLRIRPLSVVMNDACGWRERSIRLDRQ